MNSPVLTLAELEQFDPRSPQRTGERRFLCPLCGENKPKDAAHRSFCINSSNGLYHCKRCNSKGRLKDFWEEKSSVNQAQVATRQLRRSFEIAPIVAPIQENAEGQSNTNNDWKALWETAEPLRLGERHSAAIAYLQKRSIALDVACASEVYFVPDWHGRPMLGFPFKDANGEVVALSGRALRDGGIDKPASGPKKAGAFWAKALGFNALDAMLPAVILCEAPFDALSLAMAGYPALAIGGTVAPTWLHQRCAFRRVLLAFDADIAGDTAALKIGTYLASFGALCVRLRPQGAKDWNELSQLGGIEAIEDLVAPVVSQMAL